MREKTYRIALGGVLSAMAVVFMLMGAIFPFAQFCGPVLAAVCVMIFLVECGVKWAFFMYLTVSFLSFLLSPDLESAMLFTCFVGWYPILKVQLETKLRSRFLQMVIKITALCVCVGASYYLLLRILSVPALVEEFSDYSALMLGTVIVMGIIAFILVDICLTRMANVYLNRFRQKVVRDN